MNGDLDEISLARLCDEKYRKNCVKFKNSNLTKFFMKKARRFASRLCIVHKKISEYLMHQHRTNDLELKFFWHWISLAHKNFLEFFKLVFFFIQMRSLIMEGQYFDGFYWTIIFQNIQNLTILHDHKAQVAISTKVNQIQLNFSLIATP